MSCKFKQILNQDETKLTPKSTLVVNDTVSNLIQRVAAHMFNKKAEEKSKDFLKNKIISLEVDTVKQIYQNNPKVPNNLVEEISPRQEVKQCMRPMSAQVRHETIKSIHRNGVNQSKRTIASRPSFSSLTRIRPNTASSSLNDASKKKRRYQQRPISSNEKKFFAIKSFYQNDDSIDEQYIEQLRVRKFQQQEEIKKKQQFLKSIQFENKNFSQSQAKFMSTMNRKRFIYGQQGEVIEISKNAGGQGHLKKISTIAKSRVQVRQKLGSQLKKLQQQLKENIYIEFKGREGFQARPSQFTENNNKNHNKQPNTNKDNNNNKSRIEQQQKKGQNVRLQTLSTKQQIKTNNFLNINNNNNINNNPIPKSSTKLQQQKQQQLSSQQQKQQTSLKNIAKSNTNIMFRSLNGTSTQLELINNGVLLQQQEKKKKQQRIFFYPSTNSKYKVIDDFTSNNNSINVVQQASNDDSFANL